MALHLFTNWGVGVINGYKQIEGGLPNSIKYGTISIASFISIIKTLPYLDKPVLITPRQQTLTLFIGVPFIMGTYFCMGHHMGKAICYAKDSFR